MKIVVRAKGVTRESEVDPRFGRAAHFPVFDDETDHWESVANGQAQSAGHGAGIQAAETVCCLGAETLITGCVGPKTLAVLAAGAVRVYCGDGRNVADAVVALGKGDLCEISDDAGTAERGPG
jgi:predicted Fe-Mo cluster-binding NifX family protein